MGVCPTSPHVLCGSGKAFDRVPRGILWGVLHEYGVRGPLLRAVRSLYTRAGAWFALPADLQHVLERFAPSVKRLERISTSKSEAMYSTEKGGVPSP
ncbi:hypothetical protein L3Q82_025637, partial [Scortum barcoo]